MSVGIFRILKRNELLFNFLNSPAFAPGRDPLMDVSSAGDSRKIMKTPQGLSSATPCKIPRLRVALRMPPPEKQNPISLESAARL